MMYNVMLLFLSFDDDSFPRDSDFEIGTANSGTFQLVMFHFLSNVSADFLPRRWYFLEVKDDMCGIETSSKFSFSNQTQENLI